MSRCIECWLYGEGSTTRGADSWIQAGGVKYYLSAPTRFRDAMATWGGLQSAGYTLAYSSTSRRVTISAAGAFALVLPRGVANLLGFTSLSYGAATSHTGETIPAGIVEAPLGVDVYPLADGARVDLRTLRHARSLSVAWGNTQLFEVTFWLRTVDVGPIVPQLATEGGGYLFSGKIRAERGDASPYGDTNPDGYLDGWVVGIKELQSQGDADEWTRVTLLVAVDTTSTAPTFGHARLFDSVRFGWGVVWALLVEGVPTVFVERATGLTLPAGYTEDPSLIIDDSADIGSQVDRARGIGAGLSLTWALLESAAVTGYMKAPAHTATLAQTETPTAATIHVDSTAGWPAAGELHVGIERVTYTGTTSTTFTGCTRGTASSPALAYEHRVGKAGSLITEVPRWWRGRDVRLYALPCDPGGVVSSADGALLTDAEMVFRGRIDGGPQRKAHRWEWSAGALDRVLDRELVAKQSGVIVDHVTRYQVNTSVVHKVNLSVTGGGTTTNYLVAWQPYVGLGAWLTGAQMRKAWVDTWLAAVATAGASALFGALSWQKSGNSWKASTVLLAQAGAPAVWTVDCAPDEGSLPPVTWSPQTVASSRDVTLWVEDYIESGGTLVKQAPPGVSAFAIEIKDGSGIDAPTASGAIIAGDKTYPFIAATLEGDLLVIEGPTKGALGDPELAVGASVEIRHQATGVAGIVTRQILCSSGTSGLRSALWDVLGRGEGYQLAEDLIDLASFEGEPGSLAPLDLSVAVAGQSAADAIGGVFAVAQKAIVARRRAAGSDVRLACVDTHSSGTDYGTHIRDADLLAIGEEPVELVDRADPPNEMKLTVSPAGTKNDAQTILLRDLPAADVLGVVSEEFKIPATDVKALAALAPSLGTAKFGGDVVAQALTLRVGPWIDVHVGDAVRLTLTHPAIWDAAAGAFGYAGSARCVARTLNPRTLITKLTLLINGAIKGTSLSPSALVTWRDLAAPTSLKVSGAYLTHFTKALSEAGGPVKCLTYRRGSDEAAGANWCHVTAATASGSDCLLTIADWTGEDCVLASETSLTLPLLSDGAVTEYQTWPAHDQDGTRWL